MTEIRGLSKTLALRESSWSQPASWSSCLPGGDGADVRLDLSRRSSITSEVEAFVATEAVGLPDYVAKQFFNLRFVEAVAFQQSEGTLHVWTIADHCDENEADAVYDLELEILSRFEGVSFDFYVIQRHGRALEELIDSKAALLILRNHEN